MKILSLLLSTFAIISTAASSAVKERLHHHAHHSSANLTVLPHVSLSIHQVDMFVQGFFLSYVH